MPGGRPGAADDVEPLGLHVGGVGDGQALAPPGRLARRARSGGGTTTAGACPAGSAARGRLAPGQHQPRAAPARAARARAAPAFCAPGAVEAGRRVEAHRVRQAARVGEHRGGGRRDHDRARRVALERGRQRAPRRGRLDEVGDRVGAPQPPARARCAPTPPHRALRRGAAGRRSSGVADAPAERRARARAAGRRSRAVRSPPPRARARSPRPSRRPRSARAGGRGRARPARAPTPAARPGAPAPPRGAGVAGGTTSPVCAWATASEVPPTSVVTTGRASAIASRMLIGSASASLSRQSASHAAIRSGTSPREPSSRTPSRPATSCSSSAALRAVAGQQPAQPRHLLARAARPPRRSAAAPFSGRRLATHSTAKSPFDQPELAAHGRAARRAPPRRPRTARSARSRCARRGSRGARSGSAWRSLTAITRSTRGATSRVSATLVRARRQQLAVRR